MTDTPITNCYLATRELALAYFAGDPRAAAFIATSHNGLVSSESYKSNRCHAIGRADILHL
jgi:hypothetical protein